MVPWQAVGRTAVEHLNCHPYDEGLCSAAIDGIGKEKMGKKNNKW
jgi:hypothetical protein